MYDIIVIIHTKNIFVQFFVIILLIKLYNEHTSTNASIYYNIIILVGKTM